MTVISHALHGLKAAVRRPKTTAAVWLVNLLCALPLYAMFTASFSAALGASGLARGLAAKTDMNVIVEVLTGSGAALRETLLMAAILIFVHGLAALFLAGGILETLRTGAEPRPFAAAFFSGGGRFYGRFFRLGVFSLLLWIPAGALFLVFDGLLSAVQSDPNRERLGFVLALARYAFALALFHLIRMISDYARIRIAVRDSRAAFAELGRAVLFVLGRFGRTVGLYGLLGLASLAVLAVFGIMDSALPKTTPAAILAGFVLTQIFIAARAGLKIAFLSAQRDFYLRETKTDESAASAAASPALAGAAQNPRREVDKRPEELQAGIQRDADQAERQEKQPDERVQKKNEEGQGPADDKQNQP
jgi:hypothetical protein